MSNWGGARWKQLKHLAYAQNLKEHQNREEDKEISIFFKNNVNVKTSIINKTFKLLNEDRINITETGLLP